MKKAVLRVGMSAKPVYTFPLSSNNNSSLSIDGSSYAGFDGYVSVSLEMYAESFSTAFSTLYGTYGTFSAVTDYVTLSNNSGGTNPLILNYDHSQTPVKYIRFDDVVLSYESGNLISVTRESGDVTELSYDADGRLLLVTDTYTDVAKHFDYTGDDLTGITVAKLTT